MPLAFTLLFSIALPKLAATVSTQQHRMALQGGRHKA